MRKMFDYSEPEGAGNENSNVMGEQPADWDGPT